VFVEFVNRVEELRYLTKLADRGFYPILYIYGSEGCGKTRLLKELRSRLGSEYSIIYIDALAVGPLESAIYAPQEVVNIAKGIISEVGGAMGKVVAELLPLVMSRVTEKLVIRGKKIIVIVDDVARPLGVDIIELYAKKLLEVLENLLEKGASSVLIVATTSEGLSRSKLLRHRYARVEMLWNLPNDAAEELAKKLGAPNEVIYDVITLTGGNPGAIYELSYVSWDINEWVRRSIRKRLEDTLRHLTVDEKEFIKEVVDDVDKLPSHKGLTLKLMEYNLITPVDRPALGYTPPIDKELGIGVEWAWQLPIYKEVLKELTEKGKV